MEKSTENKYKFSQITDNNIRAMGVQALATRPNAAGGYGQGGLSATELKLWFDKLVTELAKKINEIGEALNGEEAAKYIGLAVSGYKTLDELIAAMQNGRFADEVLKVFPRVDALEPQSLQSVINGIAQAISELEEDKLDKQAPGVLSAYTAGGDNQNGTVEISEAPKAGAMPRYNETSSVATNNPEFDKEKYKKNEPQMPANYAMNYGFFMSFMQEMSWHIGAGVSFEVNRETYEITFKVVNVYGDILTEGTIDLPIEQLIADFEYENGDVVVTLKNGNKKKIPVATMVGGLASDEEVKREIGKVDARLDALFEEYIDDINELVGGDYADYS